MMKNSLILPTFLDSKSAILFVRTEEGKTHIAWENDDKVISFEDCPSNYPSASLVVWENKRKWLNAISGVEWICRDNIVHDNTISDLVFHAMDGWVQTDGSRNQYKKTISKTSFLFREDRIIDPITKDVELYESEIDLEDYSWWELIANCAVFGYRPEQVAKWLIDGTDLDLIAECVFELED